MNLSLDQLTDFARALFEEHYSGRPGRESDGKRHQDRESMAWSWMRLAVRYNLRSLFKPECRDGLEFGT